MVERRKFAHAYEPKIRQKVAKSQDSTKHFDIVHFAKTFSILLVVSLSGYFLSHAGLSFLWILLPLAGLMYWQKVGFSSPNLEQQEASFWRNEAETLREQLHQQRAWCNPFWVEYFNVDTAQWTNHVIQVIWPHLTEFLVKNLRANATQTLQSKGIFIENLNFGSVVSKLMEFFFGKKCFKLLYFTFFCVATFH